MMAGTTFLMVNNMKLCGGFQGNESSVGQRNRVVNKTILSGGLGVAGDSFPRKPIH